MEKKKILITLGMVLTIILTITGSTYAYWEWVTSEEQGTNVVFTLEQDFWCAADGGGDITSNDVVIAPTSCTNSDHTIMREITVTPNILRDNLEIGMDLWLNIDYIDEAFSDSENLMYALTTKNTSCTKGVISSGTFNGLSTGNQAPILEKTFSTSNTETYYLWVWLDSKETNSSTMEKNFQFSIGGNCTDTPQDNKFYVVYSADDTSLRFYQEEENVINVGSTYDGRTTTAVYKVYETDIYSNEKLPPWNEYSDEITNVVVEDEITPTNTQFWFSNLTKAEIIDVTNLDVSQATNMRGMFNYAGSETEKFTIKGLENFNTSNVVEMSGVFNFAGSSATDWNIGNLSNWDTSKVQNMQAMFQRAGSNASTVEIGDLSNWDVSNVANMGSMFSYFGIKAQNIDLGNLGNWDVSGVTNMYALFASVGSDNASSFYIGDLSNWDVSNVTNMSYMFYKTGPWASNIYIGNLSNWDVSKVTNMSYMFARFCADGTDNIELGNLGKWDVSKVTNMNHMFYMMGYNASNIYIGDLSTWNVANVIDMSYMFSYFGGVKAQSINLGNLGNWSVSKVEDMTDMFYGVGNNAINVYIGDLSNWNVSNVVNMSGMFASIGAIKAESINFGDLSQWDVSNVVTMSEMFYQTGYHADWTLDLSNWNVSKVTSYDDFNTGVESKVIAPTWKN